MYQQTTDNGPLSWMVQILNRTKIKIKIKKKKKQFICHHFNIINNKPPALKMERTKGFSAAL